jgi:hypothetical protein
MAGRRINGTPLRISPMSDGVLELLTAVFEMPPPPCEAHACVFFRKCATERLACQAYLMYVRTGAAERPTGLPSRFKYDLMGGAA